MVSATYPDSIQVFTTKVDKVDVVDDDHINQMQEEIIALQTFIGTNPEGQQGSFADRVNAQLDGSGYIIGSDGVPFLTAPRKLYYRTDEEQLYIVKTTGVPQAVGGSLSNVVFSWAGVDNRATPQGVFYTTSNNEGSTAIPRDFYLFCDSTTFQTLLNFRFRKISGISNLILEARLWGTNTTSDGKINLDVGGVAGTARFLDSSTPTWYTGNTLDVSGLANGTTFDAIIQLAALAGNVPVYCSGITVYAE